MHYCINCGKVQSKLNGSALCKKSFTTAIKGVVPSKDTLNNKVSQGNVIASNEGINPLSVNSDVTTQPIRIA